jgi:hypothetical protein
MMIQESLPEAMAQTAMLPGYFSRANSERQLTEAIHKYCRDTYEYAYDPVGVEYIRMPAQSFKDRKKGIDCEDYSLIVAAILVQLDFVPMYRIVDYGEGWAHIYVIAHGKNRSFIVDPVQEKFGHEDRYVRKIDMPVARPIKKGLGQSLNAQIQTAEIGLYFARKELMIEGDRNGWFGKRTPEDKKRLAKVEKFEKQLKALRIQKSGLNGLWDMTTPELRNSIASLKMIRAQYSSITPKYKDLSRKIASYQTELNMRDHLGIETVPDTATMLRMQNLAGKREVFANQQRKRIQQLIR